MKLETTLARALQSKPIDAELLAAALSVAAEASGDARIRHAARILAAARSSGRPPKNDGPALAEINRLIASGIPRHRAIANVAADEATRHRLRRKLRAQTKNNPCENVFVRPKTCESVAMNTPPEPTRARDHPRVIELVAKKRELQSKYDSLTDEIIAREAAGEKFTERAESARSQRYSYAAALINGRATQQNATKPSLADLYAQRAVLEEAIEILSSNAAAARAAAIAEVRAAREKEWHAILRAIAQTLINLNSLLRQRDELAKQIGANYLIGQYHEFFPRLATRVGPAYEFLRVLAQEGIISEKEFADALE